MNVKLKKCASCNLLKYIWKSHGKEKFCKECWYQNQPPKRILPISKKMKIEVDKYTKQRLLFLIANPYCKAKLQECTHVSTDVHHSEGRTGENHLKMSTWVALCRSCHQYLELHPLIAKELGFSKNRLT